MGCADKFGGGSRATNAFCSIAFTYQCATQTPQIDALALLLAHEQAARAFPTPSSPTPSTTITSPSPSSPSPNSWQFDAKGRGLLHLAAEFGRVNVVAYLLRRGADEGALDHEGRSALECARAWGHWHCAAVLEDAARARVLRAARRAVDVGVAAAGAGAAGPCVEVDVKAPAGAVAAFVVEVGPAGLLVVLVFGWVDVFLVLPLHLCIHMYVFTTQALPTELYVEVMDHFPGPRATQPPQGRL